jgi:anti-sigma factor RsiW
MNRNACESYEIHISALMDGEAAPTDAMMVLDHLPGCEACQRFYTQARELQELVDARPVTPGSTEAAERALAAAAAVPLAAAAVKPAAGRKVIALEKGPRWLWGLAAGLLLALGFSLGHRISSSDATPRIASDGDLVVEIASDQGQMSEERFVALAVELLRADRKYHHKMSEVLDEVDARRYRNLTDSELASYRDERPSAFRSEEGGESAFSEALQLSPLRGVY